MLSINLYKLNVLLEICLVFGQYQNNAILGGLTEKYQTSLWGYFDHLPNFVKRINLLSSEELESGDEISGTIRNFTVAKRYRLIFPTHRILESNRTLLETEFKVLTLIGPNETNVRRRIRVLSTKRTELSRTILRHNRSKWLTFDLSVYIQEFLHANHINTPISFVNLEFLVQIETLSKYNLPNSTFRLSLSEFDDRHRKNPFLILKYKKRNSSVGGQH